MKSGQHSIEKTDILCYLTNFPTPRMQKKIKVASQCGNVSVVYWKRSDVDFQSGLSDNILEIPVRARFLNNRGIFRIIAFMMFAVKSWPLLFRAARVKKIYVNYLDVLLVSVLIFRKKGIEFIYAVGDLASIQYGGNFFVTRAMKFLEKILMKQVSVLILSSPFFWSEYYRHIYQGRWELIENMPEKKIWDNFLGKRERNPCVIGYIGWLRDRRPILCLFKAVGELRQEGYDISVFFAGFGPDDQKIRQAAANLDFVSFYGHYQYDREAPDLYRRVDIVFSVYDISIENAKILLPNRFYESVVCGLPIIVAKETKLKNYIDQYGIGYSVGYLSADDMKKALVSHVNDDAESRRIKKALEEINQPQFFYDQYYPVLKDIFTMKKRSVNEN